MPDGAAALHRGSTKAERTCVRIRGGVSRSGDQGSTDEESDDYYSVGGASRGEGFCETVGHESGIDLFPPRRTQDRKLDCAIALALWRADRRSSHGKPDLTLLS